MGEEVSFTRFRPGGIMVSIGWKLVFVAQAGMLGAIIVGYFIPLPASLEGIVLVAFLGTAIPMGIATLIARRW